MHLLQPPQAKNLIAWLELGREAVLPVRLSPEALRRTERLRRGLAADAQPMAAT